MFITTSAGMIIAILFIIVKKWKEHRYPLPDKFINTMEYYSSIKKNTFVSVLMRWMKLEPIQSEVSKKEKTPIQYTSAYIWNLERW